MPCLVPLARKNNKTGKPQFLEKHLEGVAKSCADYAKVFNSDKWGHLIGRLHDIGKAQKKFQEKLDGKKIRVEHSGAGAVLLRHLPLEFRRLGEIAAFAVLGHHGGLPDSQQMRERMNRNEPVLLEIKEWGHLKPDQNLEIPPWLQGKYDEAKKRSAEFWVRFLFSCLVDADRQDAENFDLTAELPEGEELKTFRGDYASIEFLQKRLDHFIDDKTASLSGDEKSSRICVARAGVLRACREAATQSPGFFSLNVPTGGGKTLSGMSFALNHAKKHEMRRVFCVIPYTSIIEQNAFVYREALGNENVLEHHCNYDISSQKGEKNKTLDEEVAGRFEKATENWDFPIIVTTTVQFFETLFSNSATRCRKLHNIAKSVILLDEAQSLPLNLLDPILEGMHELVDHYGCSVVISTATQPALDKRLGMDKGLKHVHPIIPEPQLLFKTLKRVRYHWPAPGEKISDWEELAARALKHRRVLLVTHKRADARELTRALQRLAPESQIYHLSAQMCPAHRLEVIEKIRETLKDPHKECRVISTQLIEAGVDLDFETVYRSIGGLDSIVQVGGRCNREGREGLGDVFLYRYTEPPDGVPRSARDVCDAMLKAAQQKGAELDLDDPQTFRDYFRRLYMSRPQEEITAQRAKFNYEEVNSLFRMIEDDCRVSIVVPHGESQKQVQEIQENGWSKEAGRKLQRYTVQITQRELEKMSIPPCPVTENVELYLLSDFYKDSYDPLLGLLPSEEMMIDQNRFISLK